jgi:hypothetical protein
LVAVLSPFIFFAVLLLIAGIVHLNERRTNPLALKEKRKANPFERALFMFGSSLGPLYTYLISVAMAPFRCLSQPDGYVHWLLHRTTIAMMIIGEIIWLQSSLALCT